MVDFRNTVKILMLVSPMLLSSCAITAPPEPDLELRRDALTRWAHCIEQFSVTYQGTLRSVKRSADARCEGHRRDVLATFPPHMANQVDSLLSQQSSVMTTARYVKAKDSGDWADHNGHNLESIRIRLLEARQHDL